MDLTIGDLAARTGLTPATIRAWESRHGFPRPRRLDSGHRRYDERDVALLRQVLRRKAAGVRLESAIEEAAAARRTPPVSVYAELRREMPQLAPQVLRKSTLLALTWAMEDECCARAQRPTLFAAFQHERYYKRAKKRWDDLARTAQRTVVFADWVADESGGLEGQGSTVLVPLPDSAPMQREWSLVCEAEDYPVALAAWELPGQESVPDPERRFEAVWTLDPVGVRQAALACIGLVEQLAPEHALALADLTSRPAAAASDDLRAATTMFARLVSYVDQVR